MTYRVVFESNAFRSDSLVGRMLSGLTGLSRSLRRTAGVRVRVDDADSLKKLSGISQRTFERAMDWADADFDRQMTLEQWKWKGPDGRTRRKNGQVVTEPRDIVDTGALLQSKKREAISSSITEFSWEDPIAGAVHDGMTLKGGGNNPARPWTEPTMQEIEQVIDTIFNRGR